MIYISQLNEFKYLFFCFDIAFPLIEFKNKVKIIDSKTKKKNNEKIMINLKIFK